MSGSRSGPGRTPRWRWSIMREWVVELDRFDKEFVRRYTNATYLIGDGRALRPGRGHRQAAGGRRRRPARVGAVRRRRPGGGRPGGHLHGGRPGASTPASSPSGSTWSRYTPEHASEITTVPAATIRRLAREMVEAAADRPDHGHRRRDATRSGPRRPAWYRGHHRAHRHSMHSGMAHGPPQHPAGRGGRPGRACSTPRAPAPPGCRRRKQDGLLIPGSPYGGHMSVVAPTAEGQGARDARADRALPGLGLRAGDALARASCTARSSALPYRAEVLIQSRCNIMTTSGDPQVMAEALRTIPFICSMNTFHDETSEFADLLLPDTHSLERLVPLVYNPYYHYTSAALPVRAVQPGTSSSRSSRRSRLRAHWGEVLLDVRRAAGARRRLQRRVQRRPPSWTGKYRLERDQIYSWEEIADRWTRSAVRRRARPGLLPRARLLQERRGPEREGRLPARLPRGAHPALPRALHRRR